MAVPGQTFQLGRSLTVHLKRVQPYSYGARKRALARTLLALPASPPRSRSVTCAAPQRVRPYGEPHFITQHFNKLFSSCCTLCNVVPACFGHPVDCPANCPPLGSARPCTFRVRYPVASIVFTLCTQRSPQLRRARLLRGHASAALQWRPVATSSSARE